MSLFKEEWKRVKARPFTDVMSKGFLDIHISVLKWITLERKIQTVFKQVKWWNLTPIVNSNITLLDWPGDDSPSLGSVTQVVVAYWSVTWAVLLAVSIKITQLHLPYHFTPLMVQNISLGMYFNKDL